MELNVMRGIWKHIRGYHKVRVIADDSGQLFVRDEKGRVGYLSGAVSPEQKNGAEFWALCTGKKFERSASPGSYSADDLAVLLFYQKEKGRWLVRFKRSGKFGFLCVDRCYHKEDLVAVNYEAEEPVLCYVVRR